MDNLRGQDHLWSDTPNRKDRTMSEQQIRNLITLISPLVVEIAVLVIKAIKDSKAKA